MIRIIYGEIWKEVKFDFSYTNEIKLEISNFGRVRRIVSETEMKILEGAINHGYKSIKLKFFTLRPPATQKRIDIMRGQIAELVRQTGKMRTRNKVRRVKDNSFYETEKKINEQTSLLNTLKEKYQKAYRISELKRTVNKAYLVHRLVAEYFVERPSKDHKLVAHLDHNKLNNQYKNIQWMTREENVEHQKKSPKVIAAKQAKKYKKRNENSKVYKLTSTKVMLIKKKINQNVPLRTLSKTFKVTETQLLRIKRGENWADIQPAN
ncbi:MAG: NUMOD4 motif-containing HNH endonuclease [Bacteroidota bacterium]|nr:NUMOD4 motif-containing HNH endonuclease [Bacteroidota bacterium]